MPEEHDDGPVHIAYGAFTPVYYRWEVQEMIPILYPENQAHGTGFVLEPNVGQVENELIPEDAQVEDTIWSLYGRRADNSLADHIADRRNPSDMVELVRNLGASATFVLPGPNITCHGRRVEFKNDLLRDWKGNWRERAERIVKSLGSHTVDVVNAYGVAWHKSFDYDEQEMPYASQFLLEELIRKLEQAV